MLLINQLFMTYDNSYELGLNDWSGVLILFLTYWIEGGQIISLIQNSVSLSVKWDYWHCLPKRAVLRMKLNAVCYLMVSTEYKSTYLDKE